MDGGRRYGRPPDGASDPRRYTRCPAWCRRARSETRRHSLDRKFMRNGLLMMVLVVGVAALLFTWLNSSTGAKPIGYGEFLNNVTQDKVDSVVQKQDALTVTPTGGQPAYTVVVPTVLTNVLADIREATEKGGNDFDPGIFT